jgi:twitching motility two-component system response regulator PilH
MKSFGGRVEVGGGGRGIRVLLIEDDPSHRALMRAALEPLQLSFMEASAGEEGVELARREKPDLILLDLLMQPIDGWQVLAHLQTDVITRDIPIVAVTIVDGESELRRLGVTGFVMKPFNARSLVREVSRVLGTRRAERRAEEDPHR